MKLITMWQQDMWA